jgi:hypothetical protein
LPLKELRGFAPIGILEYWNIGFRGLKIIRMRFLPLFHPAFHDSTIPSFQIHGTEKSHKKMYDYN